ncbi:MAG: alpha-amylase family glycosyl hydrolase [Trueperaceae bacterium]|nr:alpha-amylase family glycosyl hydrolase [Trueperaceae bacterium]
MSDYAWWQKGIVYQIYPRSFQDSDGDGVGDLPGIISRLDYVKALGVDAIWLSPIYPSPMHDFGYDIADYRDVHPLFGTMDDFDQLLEEAHQRGLKLILDLVPNHTSHEHAWFQESRKSRDNPKRDWYVWRDPAPGGGPPNNWLSCFGGSAWELDETTGQYYLHSFERRQPDLNYRNPDVMDAILGVMRFWLEHGVDGFRVDVIEFMSKHIDLPDEPEDPNWNGVEPYARLEHIYSRNQAGVHPLIRQMRTLVDSFDDRVLIGEVFVFDESIAAYYGDNDECHLPFNFNLIYKPWNAEAAKADLDAVARGEIETPPLSKYFDWNASVIRKTVEDYEAAIAGHGWGNWVLGNHDQHRVATRVGSQDQARIANMLLLTLKGTPTCYYGDEIGMTDVEIPPDKIQDPPALNQPDLANIFGRDPERTPMQWDASPHAGFTAADAEPWLPVAPDADQRNVERQQQDDTSVLALFKALTHLRRQERALHVGDYETVDVGAAAHDVFAYTRRHEGGDDFLVVLNLSDNVYTLDLCSVGEKADITLASDLTRSGEVSLDNLSLAADEGLILRLA